MSSNRTIYAVEGLFAGPTPSTGSHPTGSINQLFRIQSATYGFNIARQDVNQFGELAAIDRIILEQPTVNLEFSYLQNGLVNERAIGFTISSGAFVSAISGFLTKASDERNYFLKTTNEGKDLVGDPVVDNPNVFRGIYGFGNGFINSYSAQGAVGSFPTATVGVQALNMKIDTVTGAAIPAVFPSNGNPVTSSTYQLPLGVTDPTGGLSISVLRPGDITVNLGQYAAMGPSVTDWKLQSYNISVDFRRTPLLQLGSKYAFSREIDFPVNINASFTANVADLVSGNLSDYIANDLDYDLGIKIYRPNTATRTDDQVAIYYLIRNANLVSQDYSSRIGDNKSVTLNFVAQMAGPTKTGYGLHLSGLN